MRKLTNKFWLRWSRATQWDFVNVHAALLAVNLCLCGSAIRAAVSGMLDKRQTGCEERF